MARFTLFISLLLASIKVFAGLPDSTFIIKGKCVTAINGKLYISYPNRSNRIIIDSSTIINGNFEFKGLIAQPVIANFMLKKSTAIDSKTPYVYLEPQTMQMELDCQSWTIKNFHGSKTNDDLLVYKTADNALKEKYKSLLNRTSPKDSLQRKNYQDSMVIYSQERHELEYQFIQKHPSSFVILELLAAHYRSYTTEQFGRIYLNMSQNLQQTSAGKYLLGKLLQLQRNEAAIAPAFSSVDFKTGDIFNLSSATGKYVMLDFWGSWCRPCVDLMPQLVAEHKKFNSREVQFISVCQDAESRRKKCIEIINKMNMQWVNLWSSMDTKKPDDLPYKYDIRVYPTYVLISPEGKIINKYEGEAGFYASLQALTSLLKTKN